MWAQTVDCLRSEFTSLSVIELCSLFGRSKQAYYKSHKKTQKKLVKESVLLDVVDEIRSVMPRLGGRKLHYLACERLGSDMVVGRDAFFELLRKQGYLLRYRLLRPRTTNSYHHFHTYTNLIQGFTPDHAHELYVSDITYLRLENDRFLYLSLITDAYSHKIVGWALSPSLETQSGPLKALDMALEQLPEEHDLIHHSDRGIQYCSHRYTKRLKKKGIRISMTQSGDPRENAIAERVNGILKMEWINDIPLVDIQQANEVIQQIITVYNQQRPHLSNEMLTPVLAHNRQGILEKKWKNYYSHQKGKEVAQGASEGAP